MSAFNYILPRAGTGTPFSVSFDPCTRVPKSWKEELDNAALDIVREAKKPIWICSSGGIDSEVVCETFFKLGINFQVLSLRYERDTNVHDIWFAQKWCAEHGVAHDIVDVSVSSLFGPELDEYARNGYIGEQPFRYLQIRMLEIVEKRGGYAVLGGGEQLFSAQDDSGIFLKFTGGYTVPLEWMRRHDARHEPYFYFRTPELCASFQHISIVSYALTQPHLFKNESNKFVFKRFVLQSEFSQLAPRKKFNGLELLSKERIGAIKRVQEQYPEKIYSHRLTIADMRQQLGV
ncbi:hypothetical protein EBR66_05150 [bacterium]|nr:hypothetical protein [bacterium]